MLRLVVRIRDIQVAAAFRLVMCLPSYSNTLVLVEVHGGRDVRPALLLLVRVLVLVAPSRRHSTEDVVYLLGVLLRVGARRLVVRMRGVY